MATSNEIQVSNFRNSENGENNVVRYVEREINNYVSGDYVFEIELSGCKKAIIIILNLLTGGIGTILVPFLNKKRQRKTIVIAGILIGLFQIFHCLHFFSVLTGIERVEKIYDYISDNNFLKKFF